LPDHIGSNPGGTFSTFAAFGDPSLNQKQLTCQGAGVKNNQGIDPTRRAGARFQP
jgi:hypothetical protein